MADSVDSADDGSDATSATSVDITDAEPVFPLSTAVTAIGPGLPAAWIKGSPVWLYPSGVVRIGRAAFYFPSSKLVAADLANPDEALLAAALFGRLKRTIALVTHHDHSVDAMPFLGRAYTHEQFADLLPGLGLPADDPIIVATCSAGTALEEGGTDLGAAVRARTGHSVLAPEELLWQTRTLGIQLRRLIRDDDRQPVLSEPRADDPPELRSGMVYYPAGESGRRRMGGDAQAVFEQVLHPDDAALLGKMRADTSIAWLHTESRRRRSGE
jgi:hypothetical protein